MTGETCTTYHRYQERTADVLRASAIDVVRTHITDLVLQLNRLGYELGNAHQESSGCRVLFAGKPPADRRNRKLEAEFKVAVEILFEKNTEEARQAINAAYAPKDEF